MAGLALLAACAGKTKLDRPAVNELKPPVKALVLPPPGGPEVVSVVERRYANAIEQTIILAGDARMPGQNQFKVQFFGPMGVEAGDTVLPDPRPANADVAREMRELLPGVAMQRSANYVQNGFGPFGYALGRTNQGDLCLYAWQRLASRPSLLGNAGSIQVRLRLCGADASEASLLAAMYGFTLNASFGHADWNPLGTPPAADPRLGSSGQPIRPDGRSGIEMAVSSPPAAPVSRPRPRPAPRVAEPPVEEPLPGAPIVPPPPGMAGDVNVVVPPPPTSE